MKKEMFYQKYANTPLADRAIAHTFDADGHAGSFTLDYIYKRLNEMDKQMHPFILRQEALLKLADEYYVFKTAKVKKEKKSKKKT